MLRNDEFLLFDGAMGTMLQARGLEAGELPELLNISMPELIQSIHTEYVKAGADVITANTFGANARKLGSGEAVEQVISAGVRLARQSGARYVALDIGPIGALLEPIGTLSFNDAYELFKSQVEAGAKAGADIILIETMSDLLETKAAILAAKENCSLPVFATMTFAEDGRTFLGTSPKVAAITLCSLGVSAVGVNCSLGPDELIPIAEEFLQYSTVPVIVQANAGLPKIIDGKTTFLVSADEYAKSVEQMINLGVSVLGGCCGTTPEYIKKIKSLISDRKPKQRQIPCYTAITSGQRAVILDESTAVIGERINPTGKKLLQEALRSKNYDYIYNEAMRQQENGADILDINVGLPEIDETATLKYLIKEIQALTPLPLQIDSPDAGAVEAAVRIYNGKPIINSVNGKEESMRAIFPIVKKYGACVVALTLDEGGIPDTAEERFAIAKKIVDKAVKIGIPKEDVLIDCLVLTASTNQRQVKETLKAVSLVKSKLGTKTVLGVSNVSFGLPARNILNSTFLAAAFGAGLDMPILNPMSEEYRNVVSAFKVLNNEDKDSSEFIKSHAGAASTAQAVSQESLDVPSIIISGRKLQIKAATEALLTKHSPMDVINEYFIPALNVVGKKFETGEYFLPQLMLSAETVKGGFDVIKAASSGNPLAGKGKILLATVKGDIHDIGKNIVKMLLENYGYNIVDLGKDVDPQLIVKTVLEENIQLVGLSALMTTTVASMAETIRALRDCGASCKIMVGGAVLSEEYTKLVGADFYAKDAIEGAAIAAKVFG